VITTSHHSASRARIIAGESGFFTLSQSREGPERLGCGEPHRGNALKAHLAGLL
jgi:hypothetical protein